MLVVLAVAALAVLGCVVAVALGHGGEMTEFPPDVPPLDLPEAGQLTAVDFMSLRLPVALVGYHTQTVDETLRRVATALSERDTRIAILEQRVAELLTDRLQARQEAYAKPPRPPRTEHLPQPPRSEPTEAFTPAETLSGPLGGTEGAEGTEGAGGSGGDEPTDEFAGPAGGAAEQAAGAEREARAEKNGEPEKAGKDKSGQASAGKAEEGNPPKGGAMDATLAKAAAPRTGDRYDGEETC